MISNGIPVTTKRADGNTNHGVIPVPVTASPGQPERPSIREARAASAHAPANDGNTAQYPQVPDSQPELTPTPEVEPQKEPDPTTPTDENKESAVPKHKLTFQHFVPSVGALLGIIALAVLVGFLELPVLGAVFLLAIAPALVLLIALVRRVKVTVSDKVKGNSLVPIIATSAITATLVLLISNPTAFGAMVTSNVFLVSIIVIALAITLFLLQSVNLNRGNGSKKE